MKRVLLVLSIFVFSFSLLGCQSTASEESNEINVGVSFYPMKDILTLI